ncbi:MAG: hypothetical protein M1826_002982 [Phylliscum demangeonii]|nr:MAG: hypothetical protein M1826_002982 [Phylliscum demangeonii]
MAGYPWAPPPLVRQHDHRVKFVSLVDSAAHIILVLWPLANVAIDGVSARGLVPLKTFMQETLWRSHTSYSTLQVALYYLVSVKHRLPTTPPAPDKSASTRALRASNISGLGVLEVNVNENEMTFLAAIHWRLHMPEPTF